MLHLGIRHFTSGISASALLLSLACGAVRADEPSTAEAQKASGEAMLQEAMDAKLGAENLSDLNRAIKLSQDAIDAGLPDAEVPFAEELLASSLSQRAELICHELFETPVTPHRGQALLRMALSDLEKSVKVNSEQPQAQYLLGRLYAHLAETAKAKDALDAAIRLSEGDPNMKGKSLVIRANLQKDPAARQADFDEAVKLAPQEPDALRFRGMHYLTENKLSEAIADFNAAIAIDPEDAETYEARGMAEAASEKLDEAITSFSKAIELEPKSPGALTARARVRAIQGDVKLALADVEDAMKLRPGSQTLLLHASLLAASGKFEQALVELNVLRQVMPDSPEVLLQIAAVYQASQQTEKAIETYTHLIVVDPQNVSAFRGRADAYLSQGKQAEAIADYEAALKLDAENSGVLNNLAWVLATSPTNELRDGKRAIELAEQACKVTEFKQAHILSTLAAGYAETGDFESAAKWSQQAVDLGPEAMKGQLAKELDSYRQKKPWREETPPPSEGATPSVDSTAQPQPPLPDSAPVQAENSRGKRVE
jgi:tetratricopeptide (TPR) repeat protein